MSNKILLITRIDKDGNIYFAKQNKRLHLCGDQRKDGFWINQIAQELGKEDFMNDFQEICNLAAERNLALFTLYELPQVIAGRVE